MKKNNMDLLKMLMQNLNKRLVQKIDNKSQSNYSSKLKKIMVTGTVGKSSTTLLLKKLFSLNGYNVISGTTLNKNINSFEGLCMTLIRFVYQVNTKKSFKEVEKSIHLEMESKSPIIKLIFKVRFVILAIYYAYFSPLADFPEKTILIYEVGFDYQDESELYNGLFDSIDLSVVTNLTYEHSSNFSNEFKVEKISEYKPYLNSLITSELKSPSVTNVLKNISLEQFTFCKIADNIIYPDKLGKINNNFCFNQEEDLYQASPSRDKNYNLVEQTLGLKFCSRYIFPDTMAKNALILSKASKIFDLEFKTVEDTLIAENTMPFSRFSKLSGLNNSTIIDSSYNSDPESLSGFINNVQEVINYNKMTPDTIITNKHTLILGEMRELGDTSTMSHGIILEQLEDLYQNNDGIIEDIILLGKEWLKCDSSDIEMTDENIKYIKFKYKHFKVFSSVTDISNYLLGTNILPEDWFWIKGSQNTIFLEVLVEKLLLNKADVKYLCRNTEDWRRVKKALY